MFVYTLTDENIGSVLGIYSSADNAKKALFNLYSDCRGYSSWVDGHDGGAALFADDDGSDMGIYITPVEVDGQMYD